MHMAIPRIGIGMDSSITPLRHGGLSLVQTTDFFYPLVEDPYMQGSYYSISRCARHMSSVLDFLMTSSVALYRPDWSPVGQSD